MSTEKEWEATDKLVQLCRSDRCNAVQVAALVSEGACVFHYDVLLQAPILYSFVKEGNVDCVRSCLQSEAVLDFRTCGGDRSETVFHCACGKHLSDATTEAMFLLFVDRIETHPRDIVAWGKKDTYMYDFLSYAARYQKLSIVWPIVKNEPFFADSLSKIVLHKEVWKWELDLLAEEKEAENFDSNSAYTCQEHWSTGRMVKLCWTKSINGNSELINNLIENGADLNFSGAEMAGPILHEIIRYGDSECLNLCLRTSKQLNFSVMDSKGYTALHWICTSSKTLEDIQNTLQCVLRRLDDNKQDIVDWSQKNKWGDDLLSWAKYCERWDAVGPLLNQHFVFSAQSA